jgi:DnaK suppressor protein
MAKGMLERLQINKKKLEVALAGIDTGVYGLCCQCETDIEWVRLKADLDAIFCSVCAGRQK